MNILTVEKILRIAAYRNKYDLLSNNVAKRIFEAIKSNYQSRINIGNSFLYEQNEENKEEYFIDFFVKFINSKDIKRDIKAKFYYPEGKTEPYIDIKIMIGLNFSEQDMERLYWYLYESIRHEYEHFDKYARGFLPDEEYKRIVGALSKMNLSDVEKIKLISKYILHPIEIDSFAKSIMYVAKKRKIPYGHVIRDVLNRVLFNDDEDVKNRMSQNQAINTMIDNIENKLTSRIKEIFPAVVLKNYF